MCSFKLDQIGHKLLKLSKLKNTMNTKRVTTDRCKFTFVSGPAIVTTTRIQRDVIHVDTDATVSMAVAVVAVRVACIVQ